MTHHESRNINLFFFSKYLRIFYRLSFEVYSNIYGPPGRAGASAYRESLSTGLTGLSLEKALRSPVEFRVTQQNNHSACLLNEILTEKRETKALSIPTQLIIHLTYPKVILLLLHSYTFSVIQHVSTYLPTYLFSMGFHFHYVCGVLNLFKQQYLVLISSIIL